MDDQGFEQSPPTTAVLGISVFRVRREAAYACGTAECDARIGDVTEMAHGSRRALQEHLCDSTETHTHIQRFTYTHTKTQIDALTHTLFEV